MTMEDLKNECKWNRGNGISGMAGSKKGRRQYEGRFRGKCEINIG